MLCSLEERYYPLTSKTIKSEREIGEGRRYYGQTDVAMILRNTENQSSVKLKLNASNTLHMEPHAHTDSHFSAPTETETLKHTLGRN